MIPLKEIATEFGAWWLSVTITSLFDISSLLLLITGQRSSHIRMRDPELSSNA
jgi:hypothetical protein